tara:strand:- start:361 stop:1062 length:702 start_codon:yes stop_codon:yes gene_type:complete
MILLPHSDGEHKACEKAPEEIVKQLKSIFSNESGKYIAEQNPQTAELNKIPKSKIYIGGDHSITYHTVKEIANPNTALLIFDAHPDVFQQFDKPTHLDYLKFLIEENVVKPENVILIGIRNPHPQEIQYLKQKGITFFTVKGLKLQDTCDIVMERFNQKELYISIDIDVLDPAHAPGVFYPEPAGLTTRQLLYFLQRIRNLNPVAIDIVEVNPDNDINNITSKTAAKILAEFL